MKLPLCIWGEGVGRRSHARKCPQSINPGLISPVKPQEMSLRTVCDRDFELFRSLKAVPQPY